MKLRRAASFGTLIGLLVGCSSATDVSDRRESLGTTRQALVTTFTQGSFIIPMGTNHQNAGMVRAYGLAYALLRANVPLHWVVLPNKAQNGNDFTITAPAAVQNHETGATITMPESYRGGPFVIAAADRAAALPIIDAWLAADTVTVVHELTAGSFTADVAKTLTAAPSIAVFEDGFETIAYANLDAAGIRDANNNTWSLTSPGSLSPAVMAGTAANNADGALFSDGFPAFAFLTSEHYNSPDAEIVAEVRSWLDAGPYVHAFMQCAAATAFENMAAGGGNPGGHFLTTNGVSNAGTPPTPLTTQFPSDPLAQYDGNLQADTGTTDTITLLQGSAFRPNTRTLINETGAATTEQIMLMTGVLDGDLANGKVTYLTGHNYSTTTPITGNPLTNGTRLFYNAIFDSPGALPTGQPAMTITKSAPTLTNQSTITFTLTYANTGAAPARNVIVFDTVPAGTTFASATGGGIEGAGSVTWNLGNLAPGSAASVSFTVNVATDGVITNKATAAFSAWETRRTVDSNTTSTTRDATPPDTTIVSGPEGSVATSSATFDFSSNENGVTYECSLDGGAFAACTDPATFQGLSVGAHSLSVRAKDAAGNVDPTPATRQWTVTAGGGADGGVSIDSDGDGIPDDVERRIGTDPFDADSDDDGVPDGMEPDFDKDTDGDGLINALDPDSDNDGLFDGTEMGLGCDLPATDRSKNHCVPDGDLGATKTDPLKKDTDNGGVSDGSEDSNLNGVVDPGETDPNNPADDNANKDSDGDGLSDALEVTLGSNPNDADSDDDGVRDGDEPNPADDTDGDGKRNVVDPDSDNDGLFDGTEMGKDCSDPATDTTKGMCIADADQGATRTNPLDRDTDKGGVTDGDEDTNKNGKVDPGERDPNNKADDNPGCKIDADCGSATSGLVCVDARCVPGCRGAGGNGCAAGQVCSSTDNNVGMCAPAADAGATEPNRLEGGGIDCAFTSGNTSRNDASTGSLASLAVLALAMLRRSRARNEERARR